MRGSVLRSVLLSLPLLCVAPLELSAWFQAACQGNLALLDSTLADPALAQHIDEPSVSGHTALLYAVIHGRYETARYLLTRGADPAAVVYNGNSALHLVSDLADDAQMARLLIAAGAPLSPTNRMFDSGAGSGKTPLELAELTGRTGIAGAIRQALEGG